MIRNNCTLNNPHAPTIYHNLFFNNSFWDILDLLYSRAVPKIHRPCFVIQLNKSRIPSNVTSKISKRYFSNTYTLFYGSYTDMRGIQRGMSIFSNIKGFL